MPIAKVTYPSDGYTPIAALSIAEMYSQGKSFGAICREVVGSPSVMQILSWRKHHLEFDDLMKQAELALAELITSETIEIADSAPEEVSKARLMIKTRQSLAGKLNRSRFGEKLEHEVRTGLDLSVIMKRADTRLMEIEIEPLTIEGTSTNEREALTNERSE